MTKSCTCSLCIFSTAAVMKHITSLLFVFSAPFERLAGKCHKIQVTYKKVESPALTCIYFFLFNCFFFIPTRLSPPHILCIYLSLLSILVSLNSLHHPSAYNPVKKELCFVHTCITDNYNTSSQSRNLIFAE